MSSPAMDRLLSALRDKGPMTTVMLASAACISFGTAKAYTQRAIATRDIHVRKDALGATLYAFGPGEDPPKFSSRQPKFPEPTTAERCDPYQEAQRAAQVLANPDPLTAALLGLSA